MKTSRKHTRRGLKYRVMAEGYWIMKDPVAVAGSFDAVAEHFDHIDPPIDHANEPQPTSQDGTPNEKLAFALE